jgi:hypothetical protein
LLQSGPSDRDFRPFRPLGLQLLSRPMIRKLLAAVLVLAGTTIASYSSQNGANDYLMTLSAQGQADMLAKVVGQGCIGKIAFYMGSADDPHPKGVAPISGSEHDSFWSLKCSNQKSYVITVSPGGEGKVLECSVLEATHAGHCFKKFPTG